MTMGCSDYVLCSLFLLMLLCNLGPIFRAMHCTGMTSSLPQFQSIPPFHFSYTKDFQMKMILVPPLIRGIYHHGAFGYNL